MIHFSLPGKCGDVILSTAALHQWLLLHPDEDVVFWTEAESVWVYQQWERVKVQMIEQHRIQDHFNERKLTSWLQDQGAHRVICLNAWPDRMDVFANGSNLLTSFFVFAGLNTPSPPFRLYTAVNNKQLEKQVLNYVKQLGSPFVLISRHSKTIPSDLTDAWWGKFIRKLNKNGFIVLDNIAGNETALPHTIPLVNRPYPEVFLLSKLAKATVGARSGLTDVAAASGSRLISLIPKGYHDKLSYTAFRLEGDIVDIIYERLPPHDELMNLVLKGNRSGIAASMTIKGK